MGRDKALLEIEGQALVQRIVAVLARVTGEILLSCNHPHCYASLGIRCVQDLFPGQGPLAGLHASFHATHREEILVVACDMPRVSESLLRALLLSDRGWDAVVPCSSDGRVHPLCALYRRTCLPSLTERLTRGENKAQTFLNESGLQVRLLHPQEGGYADENLININSINDLNAILGGRRRL
jgi:molybdenum cofactor guanylyltransferase